MEILRPRGVSSRPGATNAAGICHGDALFENERNASPGKTLWRSPLLEGGFTALVVLRGILCRACKTFSTAGCASPHEPAVICISERWRTVLPSVQRGYSADLLKKVGAEGAGEYICELTYPAAEAS